MLVRRTIVSNCWCTSARLVLVRCGSSGARTGGARTGARTGDSISWSVQ